eukprot:gene6717-biopygen5491
MTGSFYVDDLVTGSEDAEKAFSLYEMSKDRMKKGGFDLRKWKTNNSDLAKEISSRESSVVGRESSHQEDTSYAKESLGISKPIEESTKVSGIKWKFVDDILEFDLKERRDTICKSLQATKRGILSALASLYDPHGLVSPVAISAKIVFQELCKEKLGWDDELPEQSYVRWMAWLEELQETGTITVPRCVLTRDKGKVLSRQLLGFGDASKAAYCTMVYLVEQTTEGSFITLLSAKTRVAPLKQLTIPRLELMSARILASVMSTIITAIGSQVEIDQIYYWSHSKTTLHWIFNGGEWKQFVQHRVNEILSLSKKESWSHVAGVDNPADIGSRGVTAIELKNSRLWWKGPPWLGEDIKFWPKPMLIHNSDEIREEQRKDAAVFMNVESYGVSKIVDIQKHSRLSQLLRVTAYVKRFLDNLKSIRSREPRSLGPLGVQELEAAERLWIKDVQKCMLDSDGYKQLSVQLGVI